MNSFKEFDKFIIGNITQFCPDITDIMNLRATSRHTHDTITAISPGDFLEWAFARDSVRDMKYLLACYERVRARLAPWRMEAIAAEAGERKMRIARVILAHSVRLGDYVCLGAGDNVPSLDVRVAREIWPHMGEFARAGHMHLLEIIAARRMTSSYTFGPPFEIMQRCDVEMCRALCRIFPDFMDFAAHHAAKGHNLPCLDFIKSIGAISYGDVLFGAMAGGHLDLCREAIERGASFDVADGIPWAIVGGLEVYRWYESIAAPSRYTAIHDAASHGSWEIFRLCYEPSVLTDYGMWYDAGWGGNMRICKFLLKKCKNPEKFDVGGMARGAASRKEANIDVLRMLVARDLVKFGEFMECCAHTGHYPGCKWILESDPSQAVNMMIAAAFYGHARICELAATYCTPAQQQIGTVLMCGAESGDDHMCRVAYEHGARNIGPMFKNAWEGQFVSICLLAYKWNPQAVQAVAHTIHAAGGTMREDMRELLDGILAGMLPEWARI